MPAVQRFLLFYGLKVTPIYDPIMPGPLRLAALRLTLIRNKGSHFQGLGNIELSEMRCLVARAEGPIKQRTPNAPESIHVNQDDFSFLSCTTVIVRTQSIITRSCTANLSARCAYFPTQTVTDFGLRVN